MAWTTTSAHVLHSSEANSVSPDMLMLSRAAMSEAAHVAAQQQPVAANGMDNDLGAHVAQLRGKQRGPKARMLEGGTATATQQCLLLHSNNPWLLMTCIKTSVHMLHKSEANDAGPRPLPRRFTSVHPALGSARITETIPQTLQFAGSVHSACTT
jgi:hypothetical protein